MGVIPVELRLRRADQRWSTVINFCPTLISVTHAYSFRHVSDDNLALQRLTKYNSLDLFINGFLFLQFEVLFHFP